MALAHARAAAPAQVSHGLVEEMELWREATYSLGVGPYGLASSLARRGLAVEVLVTHDGPVVGLTRAHAASPAVRRAIHDQHVVEARGLGVRDRIGPASLEDLRGVLASGKRAIMLVDLENLNGEPTPTGCTCGASSVTARWSTTRGTMNNSARRGWKPGRRHSRWNNSGNLPSGRKPRAPGRAYS